MSAAIAGAAIGGIAAAGIGGSVAAGIGLGATVGGLAGNLIGGSGSQAGAAQSAANTQSNAALAGIQQQGNEFNTVQGLLAPYVQAGQAAIPGYQGAQATYTQGLQALQGQINGYQAMQPGYQDVLWQLNNLTGANGAPQQQAALTGPTGLTTSPLYTNSMNLGQQAILANASATGGLRNGNTIASLGYLPGQVLSNVMQQQIGNLGASLNGEQGLLGTQRGLINAQTGLINGMGNQVSQYGALIQQGQNAAAGTGTAALNTGNNVTSLLGQQGAINAGGILAGQNAITNGVNQFSGLAGSGAVSGLGNQLASLWNSGAGISNGTTPQDLIANYTG